MFMEYRRELKVLFDNITQLVSHLLTVCSNREYYIVEPECIGKLGIWQFTLKMLLTGF